MNKMITFKNTLAVFPLVLLAACSSTQKVKETHNPFANVNIDEILTERAIAQIQLGGELLAKLIESSSGVMEKQVVMGLIEKTAQEQGYQFAKGLTAGEVASAFTRSESASIISALAKTNPKLFLSVQGKTIKGQAEEVIAKASQRRLENQKAENQELVSDQGFSNDDVATTIKNIYNGFGKNRKAVTSYVTVMTKTGIPLWTPGTCTTFKTLSPTAGQNVVKYGVLNEKIALEIASDNAISDRSTCMIERASVGTIKFFEETLNIPHEQALDVIENVSNVCHVVPKAYLGGIRDAYVKYGQNLPEPSQIRCI